jgi:hypothetical protein
MRRIESGLGLLGRVHNVGQEIIGGFLSRGHEQSAVGKRIARVGGENNLCTVQAGLA